MFAPPTVLFADDPAYTIKELIATIGGTLLLVVPIAWGVVQLLTTAAREKATKAEAEQKRLEGELARAGNPEVFRKLETQLAAAEAERDMNRDRATNAETAREAAVREAEGYRLAAEGLRAERDVLIGERDQARDELAGETRRILRALERGGQTWEEKVLQKQLVEFRRLEAGGRETPIISLLNLKGGVGKTTAAANLGAALSARGYRVLLIDLDLQGSLTGLFLADEAQDELRLGRRLLEDFLFAAFDRESPNLHDYIRPAPQFGDGSGIVPASDTLAYAEMNLTVRWFLRDPAATKDPRLLLRRELHLKRITDEFDIVLLDCPPLINVSCVNALAASDYVLIPVMPSRQATDRVTVLLKRLRDFKAKLNPDLRVMGVFANRTYGSELTGEEQDRLAVLRTNCRNALGEEVRVFDTFVRQYAPIRDAEDQRRPLDRHENMFRVFLDLAREVESYLPDHCRRGRGEDGR